MAKRDHLRFVLQLAIEASREPAAVALAPLIDYDRAHSGDLVRTLHIYLASGGNASRSAEQLYLHRSGLLYRLRRIEDLLGARIDMFENRVALEIAILSMPAQTDQ